MQKFLFWVLVVCAVFLSAMSSSVQAVSNPAYYNWDITVRYNQNAKILGESTTATPTNFVQFNTYVLGGDLAPNNPLYFIKPLQENVALVFTFDPVKKEEVRIAIAGERLDEMKKLTDANQVNGFSTAVSSYESTMKHAADELEALKVAKKDITTILKKVEEETAKHNILLEEASVKVSEKIAPLVDRALQASWDGTDTVADLAGRPAIPPDLVTRIQAFKAQGLLTEEEAAKLIGTKKRAEARDELQKYVKEGVIPESDFLRMNENVKALYPNEFYKLHEVKRFLEMQKLESEKPDQTTLNKIQEFSKTYKPGEIVPSDIRRYWVPVVRLEELQSTLRPDLIDPSLLKNRQEDYKRFNEVVERFKPRPEDVAYVQNYIQQNNAQVTDLPPEYQRMYNLARSYGAQCGAGQNWVPESSIPSGGYCVASGSQNASVSNLGELLKNRSCNGSVISAKGPGGACSGFARDCIPTGWTIVSTCVETPGGTTTAGGRATKTITCPSNAHFVPVSYSQDGGYCIANYTPTTSSQGSDVSGQIETACQSGYRRYFPGGHCLPETLTRNYLPQLTSIPGGPFYSNTGKCGQGNHWVPEPINPNGGYCAPDNYNPKSFGTGQNTPVPGNGLPKADMGNCRTPGECYDYCKSHPTEGECKNLNPNSTRPGDSGSRESQEAGCRLAGGTCDWSLGSCNCKGYKSPGGQPAPTSGAICQLYCPPGQYADNGSCSCKSSGNYPSACTAPSSCGSGWSWNQSSCSCVSNTGGGSLPSSPPYSPPPGYGSCSSGEYWNGSACVSSSPPPSYSNDPATACAQGGCSWNGSSCQCGSPPPSSPPPSSPPPAESSPPSSPPPESAPPPSSGGCGEGSGIPC